MYVCDFVCMYLVCACMCVCIWGVGRSGLVGYGLKGIGGDGWGQHLVGIKGRGRVEVGSLG